MTSGKPKGAPSKARQQNSNDREIPLTAEQYASMASAMQWPEDRARWEKIAKPTNLKEIGL